MKFETKAWIISVIIVALILITIFAIQLNFQQPIIDGKKAFCEQQGGRWYYTGSIVDGTCTIVKDNFGKVLYIEEDNGEFFFKE